MDQPDRVRRADMVGALEGLERVNRWFGGTAGTLRSLAPLLPQRPRGEEPYSLCDVGAGSGDAARAVVLWARRRALPIQITAVELNPDLAADARRRCAPFPEITVLCADAREVLRSATQPEAPSSVPGGNALARPRAFDVVYCGLFTHHFPPEEVRAWLALFEGASRRGWVVNDLERHPLAWLGIRTFGRLFSANPVFLHDGPLSVRRAYTPEEWRGMLRGAGIRGAVLSRAWAWRLLITRRKPASPG